MFKKFFTGTMQRIFLCIVLFCIIGILLMGAYSCNVLSSVLFKQTERTSLIQMQMASEQMNKLSQSIEDIVKKISENINYFSDEMLLSPGQTDAFMSQNIDSELVGACFIKSSDGREYTYNPGGINIEMIRLQLLFGNDAPTDGSIKWFDGNDENNVKRYENYYIVSAAIPENQSAYSSLYIFVHKEVIDKIFSYMTDKNNVVIIMDKGRVFAVSDKKRLHEITKSTLNILLKIYESDEGFFEFKKYDGNYITSHYQPKDSEFKFISIYESFKFYQDGYKILLVMIILIITFSILIIWIYHIMRHRYIVPLENLVEQMKNTDYNFPGEYEQTESGGEISILVRQYNDMRQKIYMMLEDIRREEEKKREAEVAALRYQINPHFFYNTLSNIKFLAISKGQQEISSTISKLAQMYKYLFSNKSNFAKLSDEIEFIRNYISLMNTRYDNRLNTFYLVNETLNDYKIPVFLLQPLIENAIVHGLSKKLNAKTECFLRISAKIDSDRLFMEIYDDGIGMSQDMVEKIISMTKTDKQEFGLGLYNTIARLKYQYGNDYVFYVDSKEGEYTKIIISVPNTTNT